MNFVTDVFSDSIPKPTLQELLRTSLRGKGECLQSPQETVGRSPPFPTTCSFSPKKARQQIEHRY